jgi:hypothetical protein
MAEFMIASFVIASENIEATGVGSFYERYAKQARYRSTDVTRDLLLFTLVSRMSTQNLQSLYVAKSTVIALQHEFARQR